MLCRPTILSFSLSLKHGVNTIRIYSRHLRAWNRVDGEDRRGLLPISRVTAESCADYAAGFCSACNYNCRPNALISQPDKCTRPMRFPRNTTSWVLERSVVIRKAAESNVLFTNGTRESLDRWNLRYETLRGMWNIQRSENDRLLATNRSRFAIVLTAVRSKLARSGN